MITPLSTLWEETRQVAEAARAVGTLDPIETRVEAVEDEGWTFQIHVVTHRRARLGPRVTNPFLSPEPALVVRRLPDHALILNRYPVVPDHLLLITAGFVPQSGPLTLAEAQVLLEILALEPCLAFYNSDPIAGASQPHRHLQIVRALPMPLAPLYRAGELPFVAVQAPTPTEPAALVAVMADLHTALGAPEHWNFLVDAERVVVVRRTQEHAAGVSLNALAFAGMLLVSDAADLARVREAGPLGMLRAASG